MSLQCPDLTCPPFYILYGVENVVNEIKAAQPQGNQYFQQTISDKEVEPLNAFQTASLLNTEIRYNVEFS